MKINKETPRQKDPRIFNFKFSWGNNNKNNFIK